MLNKYVSSSSSCSVVDCCTQNVFFVFFFLLYDIMLPRSGFRVHRLCKIVFGRFGSVVLFMSALPANIWLFELKKKCFVCDSFSIIFFIVLDILPNSFWSSVDLCSTISSFDINMFDCKTMVGFEICVIFSWTESNRRCNPGNIFVNPFQRTTKSKR